MNIPAYLIQLRQELASLQHEIWAYWMNYLFSVCVNNADGSVTIPKDKVERWVRQMNTPYSKLSDKEQQSDIHQADKALNIIINYVD